MLDVASCLIRLVKDLTDFFLSRKVKRPPPSVSFGDDGRSVGDDDNDSGS
jgi:hypothetical protein